MPKPKPKRKPAAAARLTPSTLHQRGRSAAGRAKALAGAVARQGKAAYETMQRAGQALPRSRRAAAQQMQAIEEKKLRKYVRRTELMFQQQRLGFKKTQANVLLLEMSWRMEIPPQNLVEIFRNQRQRKLLAHEMNQALKQADQLARTRQPLDRAFQKVAQDLAYFNKQASRRKAA